MTSQLTFSVCECEHHNCYDCEGNVSTKTWANVYITSFSAHMLTRHFFSQQSSDLCTRRMYQAAEDEIWIVIRKMCPVLAVSCVSLVSLKCTRVHHFTLLYLLFFCTLLPVSFVSEMSPATIFLLLTQFHLNANAKRGRKCTRVSAREREREGEWIVDCDLKHLSFPFSCEHQKQRIHCLCARVKRTSRQCKWRERRGEERSFLTRACLDEMK